MKVHVFKDATAEVFHFQNDFVLHLSRLETGGASCNRAADHMPDNLIAVRFIDIQRRHTFAVAQNSCAIANTEDFFKAMADINDGDAAGFKLLDDIKQCVDLVIGQRRRRLI